MPEMQHATERNKNYVWIFFWAAQQYVFIFCRKGDNYFKIYPVF